MSETQQCAGPAAAPSTGFESAWRKVLIERQTLFELLLATARHTGAGHHPVALADLAAGLHRPADETARLLLEHDLGERAWFRTWVDNGLVHFRLQGAEAGSRYRYRIDSRILPVDGCAPDSFILAYGLRKPFEVESACPVTGVPIRVGFAETGAVTADPSETVVAVIHPESAARADICVRQPFFASPAAATAWLDRNPGGRVMPVLTFDAFWRGLLEQTHPRYGQEI